MHNMVSSYDGIEESLRQCLLDSFSFVHSQCNMIFSLVDYLSFYEETPPSHLDFILVLRDVLQESKIYFGSDMLVSCISEVFVLVSKLRSLLTCIYKTLKTLKEELFYLNPPLFPKQMKIVYRYLRTLHDRNVILCAFIVDIFIFVRKAHHSLLMKREDQNINVLYSSPKRTDILKRLERGLSKLNNSILSFIHQDRQLEVDSRTLEATPQIRLSREQQEVLILSLSKQQYYLRTLCLFLSLEDKKNKGNTDPISSHLLALKREFVTFANILKGFILVMTKKQSQSIRSDLTELVTMLSHLSCPA
jgi:hypothetical protein